MLDGYFKDKTFILPIKVYFEDTDLSGVVYHANYLRYMERARSEYFLHLGIDAAKLDGADPTAWALRKAELDYLRPARFGDLIEVHSVIPVLTGARLTAIQHIFRGDTLLVRGRVEACVMSLSGKPRRIPDPVRRKIEPFVCETVG